MARQKLLEKKEAEAGPGGEPTKATKKDEGDAKPAGDEEVLDFMIDPVTGKKMTKKRMQQLHQQGQLSTQQISELEKRGILNLT